MTEYWHYLTSIHSTIEPVGKGESMKYTVQVNETQYWVYEYAVEAKSSEEALHLAEVKHFEGVQSEDSILADAQTMEIRIKDAIDKEFFNRITNNLLGEQNA